MTPSSPKFTSIKTLIQSWQNIHFKKSESKDLYVHFTWILSNLQYLNYNGNTSILWQPVVPVKGLIERCARLRVPFPPNSSVTSFAPSASFQFLCENTICNWEKYNIHPSLSRIYILRIYYSLCNEYILDLIQWIWSLDISKFIRDIYLIDILFLVYRIYPWSDPLNLVVGFIQVYPGDNFWLQLSPFLGCRSHKIHLSPTSRHQVVFL